MINVLSVTIGELVPSLDILSSGLVFLWASVISSAGTCGLNLEYVLEYRVLAVRLLMHKILTRL